ncbi:MAG: hypothetical protein AB8G05_01190 [Oligoflexales bacterium]
MKIFEIQLKDPEGKTVYKSLVPEVHVQEKVGTLLRMNEITQVGAIFMKDVGDISDRYIQKFSKKSA